MPFAIVMVRAFYLSYPIYFPSRITHRRSIELSGKSDPFVRVSTVGSNHKMASKSARTEVIPKTVHRHFPIYSADSLF